jgi:fatty acid desaturase
MKTLLAAILQMLVSFALFFVGTLVAGFFLVIFLIGGWPLTILLVIVAVQKIYFPPEVRRNISARFNRSCRYAPDPGFRVMPIQELHHEPAKGDLRESDERIPTLLN